MKLLIYEHASVGGFADGSVSPGILAEGFGMLRSVVSGFKAAGHQVTVLLAAGLSKYNPPLNADCVIPVFSFKEARDALRKACEAVDAAYIIAPETGGTLQSLVELVEQTGVASLNCQSSVIQKVADKAVLYETLKKKGLLTPETIILDFSDNLGNVKMAIKSKLWYPVVFKPLDGVGCGGLSIVSDESQVAAGIAKIKTESSSERFIVQEYVGGAAVSVSLLSTGNKALPVSLNKQEVTIGTPDEASSYDGGCVPFEHALKREAFGVAEEVVGCFGGLRGYVGVDFVMSENGPVVVDVNPRLTTSFVGLSKVAKFNVSGALMNAVLEGELPATTYIQGFACFAKVQTSKPTSSTLQRLYGLEGVVSPPFPIPGYTIASSLILSKGDTSEDAKLRLEEAKKRTLDIVNRG